ncbi:MAG TPA: hypothetical protein VFB71_06460, partial [Ramlibacter sp.]|nr:hypothetical protein [Ramlibacter sp.]
AGAAPGACYVRLGRGEPPPGYSVPAYAPWRQLVDGGGPVLIAVGPLAGTYIQACLDLTWTRRPRLWAAAEMPLSATPIPPELLAQIQAADLLAIAEEHVAQGGFAAQLLLHLAGRGVATHRFTHLHARAHHYERYGSQPYLRRQSGLEPASMLAALDLA